MYEVKNNTTTHKIALANIIKIEPGSTEINGRRLWSVIYRDGANEKQVQFYNNLTLWNRNFTTFLATVKSANPEAVIKERLFFNLRNYLWQPARDTTRQSVPRHSAGGALVRLRSLAAESALILRQGKTAGQG